MGHLLSGQRLSNTEKIKYIGLDDLDRFDHPSKLMAHLGLIPSEHSTGESIKRGPITKTGNGHVRRVLVEAAQAYQLPARVSRILLKRQEGLDPTICGCT
jgi:transposase